MTQTRSPSMEGPGGPRPIPAGGRVTGHLRPPSSKSLTHRYLNLALLARRPLLLERPLLADDTRLFLRALEALGFEVTEQPDRVELAPARPLPERGEILCGNAGTMLRFLVATLTVIPGRWTLDGIPRLRERPVGPLVDALRRLGARLEGLERDGFAPLAIEGPTLGAGRTVLDAGESSQYLSALLMAALRAPGEVTVTVRSLASRPYVDITLEVVEAFGGRIERLDGATFRVRPSELAAERVTVEGDFSAAAYPAAAAALTGGRVRLEGLREDSAQGDRGFLEVLARMGATCRWHDDGVEVTAGRLEGVEVDLSAMPDQVPTLAALAPFARGTTRITNVAHLRIKESDRLRAMASELSRAGVPVEEEEAGLTVPGVWADRRPPEEPVVIDPHDDHRIAMSLALVGLRRPGLSIADPHVVGKSYPGFWRDLDALLESPAEDR